MDNRQASQYICGCLLLYRVRRVAHELDIDYLSDIDNGPSICFGFVQTNGDARIVYTL